jgi:2-polyprenyl-3-methyl-5-hydroxy-6-metoxy-1,4-benzoquinol methylase
MNLQSILDLAFTSTYDFRQTAHPEDPLAYLFDEWVPYYRMKWAIARALQPKRILEIGVRFGYSAAAFLNASPESAYLGIDNDSVEFEGRTGAIHWARKITQRFHADYVIGDSRDGHKFPGGDYDLIHLDGQRDEAGLAGDLRKALGQAKYILLAGGFSSRETFLHVSEMVYRYRDLIETCATIGSTGDILMAPRRDVTTSGSVSSSLDLRETYTTSYYLHDCGGFDAYKREKGSSLSDGRLRAVAQLAELAPVGKALDLGCGRGELSVELARMGHEVLAIDYSAAAIRLARASAETAGGAYASRVRYYCGDVNEAPWEGRYSVAVTSDLIEHMTGGEVDRLYARVASSLEPAGLFVVHTFPNLWYYKYDYPRRVRQAARLGAYLPREPRSRYEELMHINEQSPQCLRDQLARHFPYVVLWFARHGCEAPFMNLERRFSSAEMRAAADLFAVAAHDPIDAATLRQKLSVPPLQAPIEVGLQVLSVPAAVRPGSRFSIRVRLVNASSVVLKSAGPTPVHLSYHCYAEDRKTLVFDGLRTPLPVSRPGSTVEVDMQLASPARTGRFLFRLTLVQEYVAWFDVAPQTLAVDEWIDVAGGEPRR